MRTLVLFRHAKSDWNPEASGADDHSRPLNARGRRAAPLMGRFLARVDQVPELQISSSALRARTTAELAREAGAWPGELRIEQALYATTASRALRFLQDLEDTHEAVLLVGHEPTWSELAGGLVGAARLRFSTGAMVRIDLDADRWRDVEPGGGTLRWLVSPKLLEP